MSKCRYCGGDDHSPFVCPAYKGQPDERVVSGPPEPMDGGPAFPHMMTAGHRDYAPGLTMRDWFAGQAMIGAVSTNVRPVDPPDVIARESYQIADAMLEARKR